MNRTTIERLGRTYIDLGQVQARYFRYGDIIGSGYEPAWLIVKSETWRENDDWFLEMQNTITGELTTWNGPPTVRDQMWRSTYVIEEMDL